MMNDTLPSLSHRTSVTDSTTAQQQLYHPSRIFLNVLFEAYCHPFVVKTLNKREADATMSETWFAIVRESLFYYRHGLLLLAPMQAVVSFSCGRRYLIPSLSKRLKRAPWVRSLDHGETLHQGGLWVTEFCTWGGLWVQMASDQWPWENGGTDRLRPVGTEFSKRKSRFNRIDVL